MINYPQPGRHLPVSSCNVPSCQKRATHRGLCQAHYNRWRKHGNLEYEAQSVKNLTEIREALGLTKAQLAREIGVHKKAIYHMENGGVSTCNTIRKLHIGIKRLQREKRERMARRGRIVA